MTLADLNFKFNTEGIDELKTLIDNSLTIDSYIEDTPEILKKDIEAILDYFINIFNTNLENYSNDMKEYFDQQAINIKNDVEKSLVLDSTKTYDIHVTEANHSINSDKLENKTFTEIVSYIVTNYISLATVNNALKFDGKTFNEVMTYIINNVKVNNAVNADTINNMTYDAIKNDIINSIDLGDGVDLDLIQNKVENEWTSYKSKDTRKFNSYDYDYWVSTIIPDIKVNNAVNADFATSASKANTLGEYSYDDIHDNIENDTIKSLNNIGVKTIDLDIYNSNNFKKNLSFINFYQTLFPNNTITLPDISSFNYSFQKQTFTYDDDGNVTEIKYFAFDKDNVLQLNEDDETSPIIDVQYVIQHEQYSYDNGNISKIQKDFYALTQLDDSTNPYIKITFVYNYSYDDNGNVTEIDQDTPVFTSITKDDLLTL